MSATNNLYEPTAEAAAKIYAKSVGAHGHSGGWIHSRTGRPLVQGWSAYSKILLIQRIVVPKEINGKTRYAINWRKGVQTHGPITCQSSACPKVSGVLYGVNA